MLSQGVEMDLKAVMNKPLLGLLGGLSMCGAVHASDASVVMPNCLAQAISIEHKVLASDSQFSLVSLMEADLDKLTLQAHEKHCGHYINVSDEKLAKSQPHKFLNSFNQPLVKKLSNGRDKYSLSRSEDIEKLIAQVDSEHIWKTLEGLTSFDDRYSRGENGKQAALWIQDKFKSMAKDANRDDVDTFLVETGGSYIQPSVVTVVGKDLPGKAIVLGAHMDTLSYHKPGADDDGSGSSSLMEATRVILNADKLDRPVYFIWYSAEEMGLVGSRKVVKHFVANNIPVENVLQFDMTGYRFNGSKKMWMIGDNVNKDLSVFVEQLIKKYLGQEVGWTKCNYACSDHASWTQAGFKSAFPFEAKFGQEDPYIHSSNDTMQHVSIDHMTNFSKLAVAFVIAQTEFSKK
jgi:leucyl aminopeptidase